MRWLEVSQRRLAALFAGVFSALAPSQNVPSHHTAQVHAMQALLTKSVKSQHLAGMGALDVFPELPDTIHPDFRRITAEQLLSHHAGIPATGNGSEQRAKLAAWVLQHAPANSPGTKGLFLNAGFSSAAAMAERVTGSNWETLVTSQVLEPLGMHAIYGNP